MNSRLDEIKARADAATEQLTMSHQHGDHFEVSPYTPELIEYFTYVQNDEFYLLSEIDRLTKERDKAVEDLEWLASTTADSLRCNICKYNPDDMGCELDGSQFDDDGECHFTYWRRGEGSE